jgi:hypothetical protein
MLPTIPETSETMQEKLRSYRDLDPDTYRAMFRPLLAPDALPSDALSDQQLEIISGMMVRELTRQARKRALAKLH